MEKPSFFIMDFEDFYGVLLRHKYFDVHTFENETTALLNIFEIFTKMHFVSIFFLNDRNATSLLMIHLKCTVVHYANLKSSSINKLYLRANEHAVSLFFLFLICLF